MTNPLLPWSHTKLENFDNCPKKAYHIYVLGEKEVFKSDAQDNGINNHKALEDRLIGNKPLPAPIAHLEPLTASFKHKEQQGWEVHSEYKMAIAADYAPTDYWDKTGRLWARNVSDVVAIPPTKDSAVIVDWKDGKRRDKSTQLERISLFIFSFFPLVKKITAANVWLKEGKPGPAYQFTREQLPEMRANVEKVLERVETSNAKGVWPENPGPLCGYCHIKSCRFNKS